MAGLFDFLRDNPAITQGLLAGGFGAMAGRGSKLQAWGQGGLAGLQGYGNALNAQAQEQDRALAAKRAAIQEQMLQMQLENAQRQQQGQKATQDYLTQALSPIQPIDANAVSGVMGPRAEALKPVGTTPGFNVGSALKAGVPVDALGQIQQMLQKQQPKLETLAPGAKAGYFGPNGWVDVANNPVEAKPEKPSLFYKDPETGKTMVDPVVLDVERTMAALRRPVTSVNVNTKQETEEAKAVGKLFGEQYGDIQKAGLSAGGKLNRLDRMASLTQGVSTGKLAPAGKEVASYLKSVGINVDPNLGNKEAIESLSNEMALEMRNPSGGAGMPGAMSDQDRQFLQNIVPGLSKTPEGNRLLIEASRRLAKRDQDVARLARDYRQKAGTINEGFYNELSNFSEKNPLFGDLASPKSSGGLTPSEQRELEALRSKLDKK